MLYLINRFQVQNEAKSFGAGFSFWIKSYIYVIKAGLIPVCILDLNVYIKYRTIPTNMELDFILMNDSGSKKLSD